MGFLDAMGIGMAGMFGLGGLFKTETQKLQAQLQQQQTTNTQIFRKGILRQTSEEEAALAELSKLTEAMQRNETLQNELTKQIEESKTNVMETQIISSNVIQLMIIIYLFIVPVQSFSYKGHSKIYSIMSMVSIVVMVITIAVFGVKMVLSFKKQESENSKNALMQQVGSLTT